MRRDWPLVPLEAVVSFKGGGTPSKKNPAFWGGDIPWVSPKDMKLATISSSIETITELGVFNSSASLVPENSLLVVVRSGILSRTVPVAISGRKLTVNQDIKVLIPQKQIRPAFLYYFLKFAEPMLLRLVTRGATVHRIHSDQIRSLQLPLPSLKEQRLIASILDEAFAGIETAIANTEKNLANSVEIFDAFLNSRFATLSKSCQMKTLGEIAKVKGGKRVPKGYKLKSEPTDFPYIPVKAFNDEGGIDHSKIQYTDQDVYEQIRRYTVSSRDVYISIAGTIGKTGIIPQSLDGANLTENACKLVLQGEASHEYVYFFTRSRAFQEQAVLRTRVAAQPKLALERIKTITIPIPPLVDQEKLAQDSYELVNETGRLASTCQRKLTALSELKQSLLQKAFSGELTADKLESEVDHAIA